MNHSNKHHFFIFLQIEGKTTEEYTGGFMHPHILQTGPF
jgi:hypothetical protein